MHELKTFPNDLIKTIGVIKTSVECNDWVTANFNVTVVDDGHRPIIGWDFFSQLGLSLTQSKQVSNVEKNQCLIKKQKAFNLPCLISRIDADRVPVEDYLDDNDWVTGERSDILVEEAKTKAQVDVCRRCNGEKNKSVSRFILHPKLTNPIPRTERSQELKLAWKFFKRSKRDLIGLWGTIAPGSTVVRTSPKTTAIREPGVPEVKVRNSDFAKFGTRAERNTELWQNAQRRPLPYDKTTEEKTAQHSKELKIKYRGDIKIRHRQSKTSKCKRTRKALDYFGFESSVCSVNENQPMPEPKCQKQNNQLIETVIQEEALQPPTVETSFEFPVVSSPAP